jgi:hypothetical protein
LKFILFNLPIPHNAPTAPEYRAEVARDLEPERARCLELIDRFAARNVDEGGWKPAVFGPLTGREWSRLQAVHLDHHLKQFGA